MAGLNPGDHIRIKRRLYYHHGIYIGDNKVIHYAPPPGSGVRDGIGWRQIFGANSQLNLIHITDLDIFQSEDGTVATVVDYEPHKVYPPLKVVARARTRLGENGYNLWGNNCAHFARWCKQPGEPDERAALWDAVWEGALLGLGAGSKARHWAGMAAGAGIGGLAGATVHWLKHRKVADPVYGEFAAYATALYFSLAAGRGAFPLGRSFRHATQLPAAHMPAVPPGHQDKDVLFVYRGGLLARPHPRDWMVTERGLIYPGRGYHIDFHRVIGIEAVRGALEILDADGRRYRLPARYAHPPSLARFLNAAVAGTELEPAALQRNLAGRLKDMLVRA